MIPDFGPAAVLSVSFAVAAALSAAAAVKYKKENECRTARAFFSSGAFLPPLVFMISSCALIPLFLSAEVPDPFDASLAAVAVFMAGAAVTDLRSRVIPFALSAACAVCGLVAAFFSGCSDPLSLIESSTLGLGIAAAVSLGGRLIVREGIGWGDVALVCAAGIAAGHRNLFFLLIVCFLLTSAAGLVILIARKGNLKTALPLAPFLLAATIVCLCVRAVGYLTA